MGRTREKQCVGPLSEGWGLLGEKRSRGDRRTSGAEENRGRTEKKQGSSRWEELRGFLSPGERKISKADVGRDA